MIQTTSTLWASVAMALMFRTPASSSFNLHVHHHQHEVHQQFHQSHLHRVAVFDVSSVGKFVFKQFDNKPGKHILIIHDSELSHVFLM
jgi:hypothetical protein